MARCTLCRIQCYLNRPFTVWRGQHFHTNCLDRWKQGERPAQLSKVYQQKQKRRRFYLDQPAAI